MIDVGEVIIDQDFAKHYQLLRSYGSFVNGRYKINRTCKIELYGTVIQATDKEIDKLDTGSKTITIYKFFLRSHIKLYINEYINCEYIIDSILFENKEYKILKISEYIENGFYRIYAKKI